MLRHASRRGKAPARRLISTAFRVSPSTEHDAAVAGLQLIHAYRDHGHRIARLDPLGIDRPSYYPPDLSLEAYGLSSHQLMQPVAVDVPDSSAAGFARSTGGLTLHHLHTRLTQIYSSSMGIETVHCQPEHMRWLEDRLETTAPIVPTPRRKRELISNLVRAHCFEAKLAKRYANVKRFGIEGAESVIVGLNALLEDASALGVSDVIMGMAHRGRLNVRTRDWALTRTHNAPCICTVMPHSLTTLLCVAATGPRERCRQADRSNTLRIQRQPLRHLSRRAEATRTERQSLRGARTKDVRGPGSPRAARDIGCAPRGIASFRHRRDHGGGCSGTLAPRP